MKITKRQLKRIIKEEKARLTRENVGGISQALIDDYNSWVHKEGHVTPAASSVMASYLITKQMEEDHNAHQVIADFFGLSHEDVMRDIKRQQSERSAMKESIKKIIVHVLNEAMPPEGVPDVVGAVSGVAGEERRQLMDALEKEYGLKARTTEEVGTGHGGVWLSGESGVPMDRDGLPMFDYYLDMDPYEFGVHPDFLEFVGEYGFFPEWNDPGTLMLWEA